MVVYEPLKDKERIFTWPIPSTKSGWIKGPGTPRWGITKAVDGDFPTDTAFQDALVSAWIMHPETEWNLESKPGDALARSEETILEVLLPSDINALANELTRRLFPDAWAFMQNLYTSAEGNESQALKKLLQQLSETDSPETPTEKDGSKAPPEETSTSTS